MVLTILAGYVPVGLLLAYVAHRNSRDGGPPQVYGLLLLTLFWLPIIAIGVYLSLT
jgi:hypothetical protein